MEQKRVCLSLPLSQESVLCAGPALSAIRAAHPGMEVTLRMPESLRESAALVPGADRISSDFAESFDLHYDLAEGTGAERADWKAFLKKCAANAFSNPYHLLDLMKKVVSPMDSPATFELMAPQGQGAGLPISLTGGDRLRISLCTSSLGIDDLQATIKGFTDTGRPVSLHLIGTLADRRKSNLLVSAWEGLTDLYDLCGKLTLSQTAEALRLSDLVLTGPGSTALLSSGYGTFTVCVDRERNPLHLPYGHGHLVLQTCESEDFSRNLTAFSGELLNYTLEANGGLVPTLEQWQAFADDSIDNYLGRIRLFGTQRVETLDSALGSLTEMQLRPLLFLGAKPEDVTRGFYRLLWDFSLSGRHLANDDLNLLHQDSLPFLTANLEPLEQVYELANFGRTYSNLVRESLLKGQHAKAAEESRQVQEVDKLIFALAESHPLLWPLAAFHDGRQQMISSVIPSEVSMEMANLFSSLQERVLVLLDLARTLFHTTLHDEPTPRVSSEEVPTNG